MENNEKDLNIENNENASELSLQEQLKAQDEFAFLDEPESEKIEEINEIQEEPLNQDIAENKTEENLISAEINEITEQEDLSIIAEESKEIEEEITQNTKEIQEKKPEEKITPSVQIADSDDFEEEPINSDLITVRPVRFQQFEPSAPNRTIKKNLDILQDIKLHISVELGRTKSSIREVMEMEAGSIVELDKIAGEQVEIFANEKLIAKGEVIVIEDKFGVRVTNTNIQKTIQ